MTQTAVECLVEQVWKREPLEHEKKVIEHVKQMEKEQKQDYLKGYFEWHKSKGYLSHKKEDLDEYYRETIENKTK